MKIVIQTETLEANWKHFLSISKSASREALTGLLTIVP